MASVTLAHTADPAAEMGTALIEVQEASRCNRDLRRLVSQLRHLRDRLAAFADRDPTPELVAGLTGPAARTTPGMGGGRTGDLFRLPVNPRKLPVLPGMLADARFGNASLQRGR